MNPLLRRAVIGNAQKTNTGTQPATVTEVSKDRRVPKITINDVRVGDLIFYEELPNDQDSGLITPGDGRVHHVEICTSVGAAVTIIGQVNRAANEERGFGELRQTRSTALRPQKDDRLVVLRCTEEDLRTRAVKYAEHWCRLVIPFNRRGTQPSAEDRDVKQHRLNFNESGRFRAIRYAARRAGELVVKEDDPRPTTGMFCSHFVVACYQVAGIDQFVKPADPGVRVQDKKGFYKKDQIPPQHQTVVVGYKRYQQSDDANDPKAGVAGIVFCNFEKAGCIETFPWEKHLTEGMKVDSKKIMPRALLASLIADKRYWDVVGAIGRAE